MDDPVEIVTLRLRAVGVLAAPEIPRIKAGGGDASAARTGRRSVSPGEPGVLVEYDVYDRTRLRASDALEGPAIIEEPSSTTVLHAGDTLTVGEYGELIIDTAREEA
jgi:N-methylhydantoinase A